jgi:hypothetical protein
MHASYGITDRSHPARRALDQHQLRRREIVQLRRRGFRRRGIRNAINEGNRVSGPRGLFDFLQTHLRIEGRRVRSPIFFRWLAIVIGQTLARRVEVVQLAHEDFRQALRTDDGTAEGWAPCSRSVQNAAKLARVLGLVIVDPDFDDLRKRGGRKGRDGKIRKWWQRPNLYRPGGELVRLWNAFDGDVQAAARAARGPRARRRPPRELRGLVPVFLLDRKVVRSKPSESDQSFSPPANHLRTDQSVMGEVTAAPSGTITGEQLEQQLQLEATAEKQLVSSQVLEGGGGGETLRQAAPAARGDVFDERPDYVRRLLRELLATEGTCGTCGVDLGERPHVDGCPESEAASW